jgi:crossover junction endodeoxyribonuclease RusA
MMTALSFTIPGAPHGKERPRLGKDGHVYTPKTTRTYEHAVKMHALVATHRARWRPTPEAKFAVTMRVYFATERRADVDNVMKAVSDAMNGVVYPDDSLIAEMHMYKSLDRERPRVEVTVGVLEVEAA